MSDTNPTGDERDDAGDQSRTGSDHNRRSVLKATGTGTAAILIGVGGVALSGTASVEPKPQSHDVHMGAPEDVVVDDETVGSVAAYATTNPAGKLSSLGVHLDEGAFTAFGAGGSHHEADFGSHLYYPEETAAGDELDTHQFTFVGFHYNPRGHPPVGTYSVPHFDFHFYFIEEDVVLGIGGIPDHGESGILGVADYDVPAEQFPSDYVHEEIRFIIRAMGEHLFDGTAPEFGGEAFTHTNVYGVYDPSIDPDEPDRCEQFPLGPDGQDVPMPVYGTGGEGRLHFVEPMITTDYLQNDLDGETVVDISTPAAFPVADDYPTEYVMNPDGEGGVYVSIDGFEAFPGSTE